jgi:hypothetical protein
MSHLTRDAGAARKKSLYSDTPPVGHANELTALNNTLSLMTVVLVGAEALDGAAVGAIVALLLGANVMLVCMMA